MQKIKVGFQGNTGAYSEKAAKKIIPDGRISGMRTLTDLFLALQNGAIDVGVIPVENSSIGTITQSLDLMDEFDFRIIGEYYMNIRHSLLGFPGTDLEQVRTVYSHYAALNQCQRFLAKYPSWKLIPVTDTAGAVKMIREEKKADTVAIAGKNTAEIYGLTVLKEDISDFEHNQTRFWAITGKSFPIEKFGDLKPEKLSLVVRLNHRAGALNDCLNVLSILNINMTSLVSRPDTRNQWSYVFFIDLELNEKDERFRLMKENFDFLEIDYKSLGDYFRISD